MSWLLIQIHHQLNEHFPTKYYIRPDSNDMITDEKKWVARELAEVLEGMIHSRGIVALDEVYGADGIVLVGSVCLWNMSLDILT